MASLISTLGVAGVSSALSRRSPASCCACASLCSPSGRAALRTTPATTSAGKSSSRLVVRAVLSRDPPQSVDPMGKANDTGVYIKGKVLTIHAPEEYARVRAENPEKLVMLECKSRTCRPCKVCVRLCVTNGHV
jgi:hypothetical protein